jgi:hypothetical protein
MLVFPEAEILRADAPFRHDRRRFDHHEPGATDGATAEMHQVPFGREAIFARILAHRRDTDPVPETHIAQLEWREKILRHR